MTEPTGTIAEPTIAPNEGDGAVTLDGGNNTFSGTAAADTVYGGDGADTLFGGLSNDHLYGQAGDDLLRGGAGDDSLFGGAGADMLSGGDGADTLFGGAGKDVFVIRAGDGADIVSDFSGGFGGGDRIEITANLNGTSIDSLAALKAVATDFDGNVIFDLGNGNSLTLIGVRTADLQSDWFGFP